MIRNRNRFDARLALLLVAVLSFPFAIIIVPKMVSSPTTYWRASALAYSACLAAVLFIERAERTQTSDGHRFLEVVLALIGLALSLGFFLRFTQISVWADLRYGFFSAFASGVFLIPQRTDKLRALAFALMAAAAFRIPLLSFRPPFVSLAIVCTAAAVVCVVPSGGGHKAIRRFFSAPAIVGILLTAVALHGLYTACRAGSAADVVVFSAAVLFSGGATIVIVARGPWWERHSRS